MEVQAQTDNQLSVDVISKYQTASQIAQTAMDVCIKLCLPETLISQICSETNKLIKSLSQTVYTKFERGIAFPTCLSVNSTVHNFCPMQSNDYTLKMGDVVKIELAVHIDGYVASQAHTIILSPLGGNPVQGPTADAVSAAYLASELCSKIIAPGVKASVVYNAIQEVARTFNTHLVPQTGSYEMKRYIIEAQNHIPNNLVQDGKPLSLDDFAFEYDQVYSINIVMSTSPGASKMSPSINPTVFQRNANVSYPLKSKSARKCLSDLTSTFSVFPFFSNDVFEMSSQNKFGFKECIDHGLVVPLPVLESCEKDAVVVQFKYTLLLTRNGPIRLTPQNRFAPPFVHSAYSLNSNFNAMLANPSKKYSNDLIVDMEQ